MDNKTNIAEILRYKPIVKSQKIRPSNNQQQKRELAE